MSKSFKILLVLVALGVGGWGVYFVWDQIEHARYVKKLDRAAAIRMSNEPQQRERVMAYLQEFEDAIRSGDLGKFKRYYEGWDNFKDSSDRNLRLISSMLEDYSWEFSDIQFENEPSSTSDYHWFCSVDVAVTQHYGYRGSQNNTEYSSFRMQCYPDKMRIWEFPFFGGDD